MTKTDIAYQRIRASILSGELAPGTSLDQEALALEIGLSTTPVREALRRLEAQQLVINRAHRDTVVTPISPTLVEEIHVIRLQLDPTAVALTAKNATDDQLGRIQEILDEDTADASPIWQLQHNSDLHREIYRCCGNSLLINMLDSLWDLTDRYRMISLRDDMIVKSATEEHAAIVAAVVARDEKKAARLMREHVSRSLANIRAASAQLDR